MIKKINDKIVKKSHFVDKKINDKNDDFSYEYNSL